MSRSTKPPVSYKLNSQQFKRTLNIYPLHEISELSLIEVSSSLALLAHLNQHWDDLLPDDLWTRGVDQHRYHLLPDNLRARGVPIWEPSGTHKWKVLRRRSTVGHEWGNVSIGNSPAVLPFVILIPNSPAAPSSSATSVVPIMISPGKSSASVLATPTSVVIHLGLVPVEVVLLLHRSSELVRMFFLVDPPPNLRARGVPGGVMIYVSPGQKTILIKKTGGMLSHLLDE